MKLNLIALAALAASGAAQASLDLPSGYNGSVAFIAYDNTGASKSSVFVDLGFNIYDFAPAVNLSNGQTLTEGLLAKKNTSVVWDFNNNTITLNGTVRSVTNNFSAVASFLSTADASDVRWGIAGASLFNSATQESLLTLATGTPSNAQLNVQDATTTSDAGSLAEPLFKTYAGLVQPGVDNGSYFAPTSGSVGFLPSTAGFNTNWNNNLRWASMVSLAVGATNLWLLDGEGDEWAVGAQPNGENAANLVREKGTFRFDAAANKLSWETPYFTPSTPAVPEPSTYALALVGLAVAGIAARRRRAV